MRKAWFLIKLRSAGFSTVELLLAITVFAFLVTALLGAIVYGRSAAANGGDRERAVLLADEGNEAVRTIRDAGYSNLSDGTYGLQLTGGVWTLSGSSDATGIFTRSVTIAASGAYRKTVTTTVSWPAGGSTSQVSTTTELTNWAKSRSWVTPGLIGSFDAAGTADGYKVDTAGQYAYIVRNTTASPNFLILDVSTPSAPVLVGSMTLSGTPTNITVKGNYAYVSSTNDNAELQIVSVVTPSAPVLAGSFDAAGTADGLGVYASGNYAYLTRAANGGNNEFVVVNVVTPSAPVRYSFYSLNVPMYEVYVNGANVFIVTGSDTQEILKFTSLVAGLLTISTSTNLPGTADATTIAGSSDTLVVGQENVLYTVNGTLMATLGSTTISSGVINDVDVDPLLAYAYIGTSDTTAEYKMADISVLGSPTIVASADVPGTSSNLTGVDYDSAYNIVVGADAADTQEAVVFGPN